MGVLSSELKEMNKKHNKKTGVIFFAISTFLLVFGILGWIRIYLNGPTELEFIGEYYYSVSKVGIQTGNNPKYFLLWENSSLEHTFEIEVNYDTYQAVNRGSYYSELYGVFRDPQGGYFAVSNEDATPREAAKEYKKEQFGDRGIGIIAGLALFVLGILFSYSDKIFKGKIFRKKETQVDDYKPFY